MQVKHHSSGATAKNIDFFKDVPEEKISRASIYYAIKATLANRRVGTASTKTRGMVAGGGKKPWRQKGLGRARAGTRTSPLWRGGGTVFGPVPHDFSVRISKKQKHAAMRAALFEKAQENKLLVVDDFVIEDGKTKKMIETLSPVVNSKRVLLILHDENELTKRAARNIPWLSYNHYSRLSIHDVFYAHQVVVQSSALAEIEKKYGVKQ